MKRRTVLGLFAGASGLSALTFGSGAFSFTRTERELTVEVEDDNDAYLGLQQLGGGINGYTGRSAEDGTPQTVQFRFPAGGENDRDDVPDDLGLGMNSIYRFVYDAGEASDGTAGLLEITNQGTDSIDVFAEQPESSGPSVGIFRVSEDGDPLDPDGSQATLRDVDTLTGTEEEDNCATVDVGESIRVGFEIDTHGVTDSNRYQETIRIVGSATGD